MVDRALSIDGTFAARLAEVALDNVAREYPNKLDHLMASDADVASPSALHPVFYGSYDWHSSVHMHWTLVKLLTHFPDLAATGAIRDRLDAHFTVDRVSGELDYLARATAASFERPYGWAWLLKLSEGLHLLASSDHGAVLWRDRLQPLADVFTGRAKAFFPRVVHPSRAGSHANNAFASLLMLDYAETVGDPELRDVLVARASVWYGIDRDYPIAYEISSEDFLSNGLLEAALMRRVMHLEGGSHDTAEADARFARWWGSFVFDTGRLSRWLEPVIPDDRSDARLTHVDGLNLSRAWCWQMLLDGLPDALRASVKRAINAHRAESLPHAATGHYVGTHWLASFALLASGA